MSMQGSTGGRTAIVVANGVLPDLALFSRLLAAADVLVAAELASSALLKVSDLSLPGYRFYVVRRPSHPREKIIRAFSGWLLSVR